MFMAKSSKPKTPLNHLTIYKIMVIITFAATGVFLLKNIIGKSMQGIIVILACLAVLSISVFIMKRENVNMIKRETFMSLALVVVVFIISISSGASYSDDFPLYLAVIGMSGMYLEPKLSRLQIVLCDIALVAMGIIHPEKAGAIGQYILCIAMFTLAAILILLTIQRGRAFIDLSNQQAAEARRLVGSMREMGDELQLDFDDSASRIEVSTSGLQKGSDSIIQGANEVEYTCGEVKEQIRETSRQIEGLNDQVRLFEKALGENQDNMEAMRKQLVNVTENINGANTVFKDMEGQMNEVVKIAKQLSDISFKTTLLSLNASVEAAHVGSAGAGFAVVANEMKELSENSDMFSNRVTRVTAELIDQVAKTSDEFEGSIAAIRSSERKMAELQESFIKLMEEFKTLYGNIEDQNRSVKQVDSVFSELTDKVSEMKDYSFDNQNAVLEISRTMKDHKQNIGRIIENTRHI